jgi:hypothetical protein
VGSISNMLLEIFEGSPTAAVGMTLVRAIYTITKPLHDAPDEQAYREEVRLVGDDRGEGDTAELLPIDAIWDGVVVFTISQVQFVRSPEKLYPSNVLDEDPSMKKLDTYYLTMHLTCRRRDLSSSLCEMRNKT